MSCFEVGVPDTAEYSPTAPLYRYGQYYFVSKPQHLSIPDHCKSRILAKF